MQYLTPTDYKTVPNTELVEPTAWSCQAGTGSDNIYYTGNPGEPYNEGSGLGYPNFGKLAAGYSGRR